MRSAVVWLVPIICAGHLVAGPCSAARRSSPRSRRAQRPGDITRRRADGRGAGQRTQIRIHWSPSRSSPIAKAGIRFPESRLEPGEYAVSIRAAGYDLEHAATASVTRRKVATLDLKLQKTRDLASQLTNADWFASFPGTEAQKGSNPRLHALPTPSNGSCGPATTWTG